MQAYAKLRESKALSQLGIPKELLVREARPTFEACRRDCLNSVSELRLRVSINRAHDLGDKLKELEANGRNVFLQRPSSEYGEAGEGPEREGAHKGATHVCASICLKHS